MDGHDLRCPARRHQQGMERPGQVGGGAERFDRRPAEPVPGEVQHGYRDSFVERVGTGHGIRPESILPGAGEKRHVGVAAGPGERHAESMRILANAGALPQRGAVVEEYAQTAGWYHSRTGEAASGRSPQPLSAQ